MRLLVHGGRYAICRLSVAAELSPSELGGEFVSWTRTPDELSVVCREEVAPVATRCETGFRRLSVVGPLDFALTGVLASLAAPLATAGIPLFAVSTFDTDHLMLRDGDLDRALEVLEAAGHEVEAAGPPV